MSSSILKEDLFFSMTWDFLNVYLPARHKNSTETSKSYEDGLSIFRRYVTNIRLIPMEKFRFQDLTYDFVLDYREYLVTKGYKPNTVNHRLAVISAYMRYAASRRISLTQIYMNIAEVPYVIVPSRVRDIIEDDCTIKDLLDAPSATAKGIRDRMILVMLYDTAIRVDELICLDLSDVNLSAEDPYIRVRGKGDKERIVALSEKTLPLAHQYISIFHKDLRKRSIPFIYTVLRGECGRMSSRNIERIVQKYADAIRSKHPDLPKKVYPHMIRRTRASKWYRDGIPIETIALIMGHSDAKTTRKSYASPSVEMLREQMSSGTDAMPDAASEQPLWRNDDELAKLCGIR